MVKELFKEGEWEALSAETKKRLSGTAKDGRKGFGSMDEDRRRQISREAANKRWGNRDESQQSN